MLMRASEYDRSRPGLPWALAIAAWECRTIVRKKARRREQGGEQLPEVAVEGSEDEVARRELGQAALDAMGELSAEDRETLIATFWEETASVSGATFRKRRERALKRLRDVFRRLYGLD